MISGDTARPRHGCTADMWQILAVLALLVFEGAGHFPEVSPLKGHLSKALTQLLGSLWISNFLHSSNKAHLVDRKTLRAPPMQILRSGKMWMHILYLHISLKHRGRTVVHRKEKRLQTYQDLSRVHCQKSFQKRNQNLKAHRQSQRHVQGPSGKAAPKFFIPASALLAWKSELTHKMIQGDLKLTPKKGTSMGKGYSFSWQVNKPRNQFYWDMILYDWSCIVIMNNVLERIRSASIYHLRCYWVWTTRLSGLLQQGSCFILPRMTYYQEVYAWDWS